MSDSPGLVDFETVKTVFLSVLALPDGQVNFFGGIQITEELCNKLLDFPINSSGLKAVLEKEAA